jgi:HK97 family phage major capsid protein
MQTAPSKAGPGLDPKRHYKSLGKFLQDVKAGTPHRRNPPLNPEAAARIKSYLVACKASGLNEATDSEGGLIVPPDLMDGLWRAAVDNAAVLNLVTRRTSTSNVYYVRAVEEPSRADGSRNGGVRAYWAGEGAQLTASRPTLRALEMRLKKLVVEVQVTEELLEDAPDLGQEIDALVSDELDFALTAAVVAGPGVNRPVGLINASSRITVAAEGSQTAGTIVGKNVVNMWARMHGQGRNRCVWLINQDIDTNLLFLTMTGGTIEARLMSYMPPGAVAGSPYAHLCGRPVIPVEQCPTLGTEGDIILFDPREYVLVTRSTPTRKASAHVLFDQDLSLFKWILRVDGLPARDAVLTPYAGTATQSPIVTLASR